MSIENPFEDHVWSPEELAMRDLDTEDSGFSIAAFLVALLIVSLLFALL